MGRGSGWQHSARERAPHCALAVLATHTVHTHHRYTSRTVTASPQPHTHHRHTHGTHILQAHIPHSHTYRTVTATPQPHTHPTATPTTATHTPSTHQRRARCSHTRSHTRSHTTASQRGGTHPSSQCAALAQVAVDERDLAGVQAHPRRELCARHLGSRPAQGGRGRHHARTHAHTHTHTHSVASAHMTCVKGIASAQGKAQAPSLCATRTKRGHGAHALAQHDGCEQVRRNASDFTSGGGAGDDPLGNGG